MKTQNETTIKSVINDLENSIADLEYLMEQNEEQQNEATEKADELDYEIECAADELREAKKSGEYSQEEIASLTNDLKELRKQRNASRRAADKFEDKRYKLEELKEAIENAIMDYNED